MLRQTKNKVLGGLTRCTLTVSKVFQELFEPTGRNPTFDPENVKNTKILQFSFISGFGE